MCIVNPIGSIADVLTNISIPFYETLIPAGSGFQSPAIDYREKQIDLNDLLIKDKEATFVVGVMGDSMDKALITSESKLIVDRSIIPDTGNIIVAIVSNEYTAKYYVVKKSGIWLVPHSTNPKHKPLLINESHNFRIWGVVTQVINKPANPFR